MDQVCLADSDMSAEDVEVRMKGHYCRSVQWLSDARSRRSLCWARHARHNGEWICKVSLKSPSDAAQASRNPKRNAWL